MAPRKRSDDTTPADLTELNARIAEAAAAATTAEARGGSAPAASAPPASE